MKKFAVLVIAVAALFYFKPGLFGSGKKGAFDAKGHAQALLFTQDGCGAPCASAVQELAARGVAFQEIKLDNDDNIKRYRDLGGASTIPLLAVGRETVQGYGKGDFASALAENFGDSVLTRAELLFYKNHFDDAGTPVVYMYGASWCGYCKQLRAEMEGRKIAFVEIDVDHDADKALIEDAMDLSGYPITYVGYKRIVGANKTDQVMAALKTAARHNG